MDDAEQLLDEVWEMFAEVSAGVRAADPISVLEVTAKVALSRVSGVSSVSVGSHDGTRFATQVATCDFARDADTAQFELGAGPAVDVLQGRSTSHVRDALGDARSPAFGRRMAERGYLSALSIRLCDRDDSGGYAAGLNLYSEPAQAFDPVAVRMATLLAAHSGTAFLQVRSARRAVNLERALATNQAIGPAIGLIMAQHRIGHDQAMDMLRKLSQTINRKVSDLAADIVKTGALRPPGASVTYLGR